MAKKSRQGGGQRPPARSPAPPRISITVDPRLRKKIRIAAALADMEDGEWCKVVLVTASKRAYEKLYGEEG